MSFYSLRLSDELLQSCGEEKWNEWTGMTSVWQMLPYGAHEWLDEYGNKRESYICSFHSHLVTPRHLWEIMEWHDRQASSQQQKMWNQGKQPIIQNAEASCIS